MVGMLNLPSLCSSVFRRLYRLRSKCVPFSAILLVWSRSKKFNRPRQVLNVIHDDDFPLPLLWVDPMNCKRFGAGKCLGVWGISWSLGTWDTSLLIWYYHYHAGLQLTSVIILCTNSWRACRPSKLLTSTGVVLIFGWPPLFHVRTSTWSGEITNFI